jgi:hypothetical protein
VYGLTRSGGARRRATALICGEELSDGFLSCRYFKAPGIVRGKYLCVTARCVTPRYLIVHSPLRYAHTGSDISW